MTASPYALLLLCGIAVSLGVWMRLAKREPDLLLVYVGALLGAFLGAKGVYLFAEGWRDLPMPDRWLRLATGKTILGALLGGYAGVELAKRAVGYTRATGDLFAIVAPVGIILGRVGCLLHGCCLGELREPAWYSLVDANGSARWPAVPVEIAFNVLALVGVVVLRSKRSEGGRNSSGQAGPGSLECSYMARGQHFHLYLMAYGVFRFLHEFFRDTPRIIHGLTGYQFAALACVALGAVGFVRRARRTQIEAKDFAG